METEITINAPAADGKKELIEKLRDIEANARHAADPREPAGQIAAALADYFEAQ